MEGTSEQLIAYQLSTSISSSVYLLPSISTHISPSIHFSVYFPPSVHLFICIHFFIGIFHSFHPAIALKGVLFSQEKILFSWISPRCQDEGEDLGWWIKGEIFVRKMSIHSVRKYALSKTQMQYPLCSVSTMQTISMGAVLRQGDLPGFRFQNSQTKGWGSWELPALREPAAAPERVSQRIRMRTHFTLVEVRECIYSTVWLRNPAACGHLP